MSFSPRAMAKRRSASSRTRPQGVSRSSVPARSRRSSSGRSASCGASSRPPRAPRSLPPAPPCRGSPSTASPSAVRDLGPTAGCTTPSSTRTVFRRCSPANPGATTSRKIADRCLGTRVGVRRDRDRVRSGRDRKPGRAAVGPLRDTERRQEVSRRLTRGARAADPDVSPDGRVIVCTIQRADRRELATLPVPTGSARAAYPAPLVSEPGVHFTSPRWSPDGLSIAVERVSTAGRAEIVLIDPATGRVARTVASSSGSRSMEPAWMADGRLLFSSDRGGDGFRIFVTDVATRATWRLEDTGANASSPEPSRDGQYAGIRRIHRRWLRPLFASPRARAMDAGRPGSTDCA